MLQKQDMKLRKYVGVRSGSERSQEGSRIWVRSKYIAYIYGLSKLLTNSYSISGFNFSPMISLLILLY